MLAQVVWGDVLGAFVAAALRACPRRLFLVTPWIGESEHARLRTLAQHARACRSEVVVVTRPVTQATAAALEILEAAGNVQPLINDQLHAKLYIAEEPDDRGVALVGSANLTSSGGKLDEVGVLVRPLAASPIIADLVRVAVVEFGGQRRVARVSPARSGG